MDLALSYSNADFILVEHDLEVAFGLVEGNLGRVDTLHSRRQFINICIAFAALDEDHEILFAFDGILQFKALELDLFVQTSRESLKTL